MEDKSISREFLKSYNSKPDPSQEFSERILSDQQKGYPVPPMQKPIPEDAVLIDLVPIENISLGRRPLIDIILQRKSRRNFSDGELNLEELSFLLFATQGVKEIKRFPDGKPYVSLRTAPSGGARHPFETYLFIRKVAGIAPGLYRYLPLDHKLVFLYWDTMLPEKISAGCCGQKFVVTGAVVFIWTVIPYRMEWRYPRRFSGKVIAQDSGHLCQNLYLAAESIGCGTCAIAAYFQDIMDDILRVDGENELTFYVAPVGKVPRQTTWDS